MCPGVMHDYMNAMGNKNKSMKAGQRKKHWLKRWLVRVMILFLIFVIYAGWQMWDIDRFGRSDDGSSADCAIVLGAAAYNNEPSPVFKERINHAISLLKEKRVKAILLTGGYGGTEEREAKFAESEVARDYCIENGVRPEQIHIEKKSKTTKENIIEAKKVMQEEDLNNALIVSDPWHLKRACNIADHYEVEARPSATTTSLYTSQKSQFEFIWKEFVYLHVWKFH